MAFLSGVHSLTVAIIYRVETLKGDFGQTDKRRKMCLEKGCTSEACFRNLCLKHSKDASVVQKNQGVMTFGRVKKYCQNEGTVRVSRQKSTLEGCH